MTAKTDNHDPRAKLELRRFFLRKYHADHPPDVLDCCQGGGVLWKKLREEFPVRSYWGVDVKPKKGRLKLDSVRILAQPGWPQNVVDVDTYGSPWKHWEAMLPNVQRPLTVFLTIGQWQMGTDSKIFTAIGLQGVNVPPGIAVKLHGIAVNYCLTRGYEYCKIMVEAVEAVSDGNARYIGVRLEPRNGSGPVCQTEPQPEHSIATKEQPHVCESFYRRGTGPQVSAGPPQQDQGAI